MEGEGGRGRPAGTRRSSCHLGPRKFPASFEIAQQAWFVGRTDRGDDPRLACWVVCSGLPDEALFGWRSHLLLTEPSGQAARDRCELRQPSRGLGVEAQPTAVLTLRCNQNSSAMSSDRTLRNAPLVEVIAEIHWHLDSGQGGQPYDPHWFRFALELESVLTSRLPVVEAIQPAGIVIPLEVLGRSPLLRFRPTGGGWPLVQLGQGIATVNAVPPYDGWDAVRGLLEYVLLAGRDASPLFKGIRPERLLLTYRDAFTARHGVNDSKRFFVDQVPLVDPRALAAMSASGAVEPFLGKCEITAPLPQLPGATAVVRGSHGHVGPASGKIEAAVLDFVVAGNSPVSELDANALLNWFDRSHEVAWTMFNTMIPAEIMSVLRGQ